MISLILAAAACAPNPNAQAAPHEVGERFIRALGALDRAAVEQTITAEARLTLWDGEENALSAAEFLTALSQETQPQAIQILASSSSGDRATIYMRDPDDPTDKLVSVYRVVGGCITQADFYAADAYIPPERP